MHCPSQHIGDTLHYSTAQLPANWQAVLVEYFDAHKVKDVSIIIF